jgi:stearoyl-CoA desaturase (delta-9 desaturase)
MLYTRSWASLRRWVDTDPEGDDGRDPAAVAWLRIVPLVLLHLSCLAVLWVGWSPTAIGVALGLYLVRMLAISAFYHRYFSHRSFKTSRRVQLVFGVLGASCVQRGPLWWASHHRRHHAHSDQPTDLHSPHHHGLLWSHIGWLTSHGAFRTDLTAVPDLGRFPELRFLDRFDTLVPTCLAALLFAAGRLLEAIAPQLGTSGPQLVVWGFSISTVVLLHVLCGTNSYLHGIGYQSHATGDRSTNSLLFALIALGEGWHNNHHRYPHVARLGVRWWEIDPTHRVLQLLARLHLIWDLREVPEKRLHEGPATRLTRGIERQALLP